MIILWTDGSASPNPGPGGFAVLREERGKFTPVALGAEKKSTNIRMEGSALVAAMEYAQERGERVEIHTDSEFWINVLTKWAAGWEKRGWRKANRKPVDNPELVKEAFRLYTQAGPRLVWERGHVGTPGNEAADNWANKARKGAKI